MTKLNNDKLNAINNSISRAIMDMRRAEEELDMMFGTIVFPIHCEDWAKYGADLKRRWGSAVKFDII